MFIKEGLWITQNLPRKEQTLRRAKTQAQALPLLDGIKAQLPTLLRSLRIKQFGLFYFGLWPRL
jgi:hypothetical protein